MTSRPRVVIIGCGFGGLFAAKQLTGKPVDVTVIDRTNHHLFQPLLYQVATAGLSAPAIAAPIRQILKRHRNTTVLMAEVMDIDTAGRAVVLENGERITYDYLVLAPGATHSYFDHPEWETDAPGLKTLADAFEIRRRILLAFERAERETDPERKQAWLTFVVVGAGATGVEMAGTLAEIARHTLSGEFRGFDSRSSRILLLEAGPRVLPAYEPVLSVRAQQQLEKLGVTVLTGARVTAVDASGATFERDGAPTRTPASTIVWAAGVAASPLGRRLNVPLDRAGRVVVNADLSVPEHAEVFVVGDLAAAKSDGKPVPGVSPAAKQMGRHAADNILRSLRGQERRSFVYRDYGSLATIGRNAAVAQLQRVRLWGFPAWFTWLFAHVYFLIGFRNRIIVLFDWAWAYVSFQRSARVIIEGIVRGKEGPTRERGATRPAADLTRTP